MMKFGIMTKGIEGLYKRMSNRCACCGQYIKADEMFGHIIVNGLKNKDGKEVKYLVDADYHKDFENRFVHEECWKSIAIDDYYEKVIYIYNKPWKRPKRSLKDTINQDEINMFKEKLISKCGKIINETSSSIKFKLNGYTYIMNKITKYVEVSYRGSDPLVSMLANASFNEIMNT